VLPEFDALLKAMAHAHEGRARIIRQRALIKELRRQGCSLKVAEELLVWMEETQRMFEEHVALKRQIAKERFERARLAAENAEPGTSIEALAMTSAPPPPKASAPLPVDVIGNAVTLRMRPQA